MKKHIAIINALLFAMLIGTFATSFAEPTHAKAVFYTVAAVMFIGGIIMGSRFSGTLMAGPQAVVAEYFNNYVSSFDLNMRKILPRLTKKYPQTAQREWFDLVTALGFERTLDVETIEHFEENWIHEKFYTSTTQAGGAAGAQVALTVAAASIDTSNRFYPRQNDIIMFAGSNVKGYIKTISGTTLNIVPLKSTDSIPATTNGDNIIIISNTWSEGSTQPASRAQGAWLYQNYFQIVKEAVGASGSQMTTKSWVDAYMKFGIEGWYNKAVDYDLSHRMAIAIQGAMLEGEIVTNTLATDEQNASGTLTGTEGLLPAMRRLATPYPYTPGNLTVPDFDQLERLLSRQTESQYMLAALGQDIDIELENLMKDYFNFTQIDYTTKKPNSKFFGEGNDGEALAGVVNFGYLTKAGRTWCFKRLRAFNDPQTFGATGFQYSQRAMLIPLEKRKDPKSKNDIPSIGIVYKAMGKYSRKMEMFDIGGAGDMVKQTPWDKRDWYLRTQVGNEFFATSAMIDMYAQ